MLRSPTPHEIPVEAVRQHRWTEREGTYAGVEGRSVFDGTGNLATHRSLLAAIASRDPVQVVEAVRLHNEQSRASRG